MIRPVTPLLPRPDHAIKMLAGHAALRTFAASMALDAPLAQTKMVAWQHFFNIVAIADRSRTYNDDAFQECELLVTKVLPPSQDYYDAANVELNGRNWRDVTDPGALVEFEKLQAQRDIAATFIGKIKEVCRSLGYIISTATPEDN